MKMMVAEIWHGLERNIIFTTVMLSLLTMKNQFSRLWLCPFISTTKNR